MTKTLACPMVIKTNKSTQKRNLVSLGNISEWEDLWLTTNSLQKATIPGMETVLESRKSQLLACIFSKKIKKVVFLVDSKTSLVLY